MRWRIRQEVRSEPASPVSIADEAERFLAGRYLDIAFDTQRDIPAWIWLSALAHGDTRDLSLAATWLSDHQGLRPEFDAWGRVLQLLAREIDDTIATVGCRLVQLQQDILQPTELAILASPVGPATLYRIVSAALTEVIAKSRSGGG
jgi:hypothetical protein